MDQSEQQGTTSGVSLQIDEGVVNRLLGEAIAKGVEKGVGSWEVTHLISNGVTETMKEAQLAQKVAAELDRQIRENADTLAADLAARMIPAAAAAMELSVRRMFVRMLYGIETAERPRHDTSRERLWDRCEEIVAAIPLGTPAPTDSDDT